MLPTGKRLHQAPGSEGGVSEGARGRAGPAPQGGALKGTRGETHEEYVLVSSAQAPSTFSAICSPLLRQ